VVSPSPWVRHPKKNREGRTWFSRKDVVRERAPTRHPMDESGSVCRSQTSRLFGTGLGVSVECAQRPRSACAFPGWWVGALGGIRTPNLLIRRLLGVVQGRPERSDSRCGERFRRGVCSTQVGCVAVKTAVRRRGPDLASYNGADGQAQHLMPLSTARIAAGC
jgi:hypothetical protein